MACADGLPWNRHACRRCAIPLPESGGVCGQCLTTPPPLDAVHAAFVYAFPIDRLVPRLKFHRDLAAGRLLADLMGQSLCGDAAWPEAIVPIPLHRARLRERGYDQALELAVPLSRRTGIALRADALMRQRATSAQSELDADARRRNLRDAFSVAQALPAHVVLVDDVMTTGATLHAAARALRKAGVRRIDAWVCARVP